MEKVVSLAFRTVARDSVWKALTWEGRRYSGRKFIKRGLKDSLPVSLVSLDLSYCISRIVTEFFY